MPLRNVYLNDEMHEAVMELSKKLDLKPATTIQELIRKGLAFYKNHFEEVQK